MDPGDEINACASLAKRGLVGNPSDGWQPRVGAHGTKATRHYTSADTWCCLIDVHLSLFISHLASRRPQMAKRIVFRETLSDRAVSL